MKLRSSRSSLSQLNCLPTPNSKLPSCFYVLSFLSLTSEPPCQLMHRCVTSWQGKLVSRRSRDAEWRQFPWWCRGRSIFLYWLWVENPEEGISNSLSITASKVREMNTKFQVQIPLWATCSDEEVKQEEPGKACWEEPRQEVSVKQLLWYSRD